MEKKLLIAVSMLTLALLVFLSGVFVYAFKQEKNKSKIEFCNKFPSKSGCYKSAFDLMAPKLLVYKIKTSKNEGNIILERNFSRIVPKILFDESDVLLGYGISKDIEFEQNYSLFFNKPSYGFDCGVESIKINAPNCKFKSECIGTDKFIKTNLGQISSKKIHSFDDKIKELKLENKKIFVKLSFSLDGEYEVLEDILKHSNQITGINIALQINDTKKIQTAIKMLELLDKDFVLVSRNASTIHKNDKDKFGSYINSSTYNGYLGYNLFFLTFANKNILNDYSISLNQNDSLIYFFQNTTKAIFEKGKLECFKIKDAEELNISKGKIKFNVVFIEKLKEAGIIKTKW